MSRDRFNDDSEKANDRHRHTERLSHTRKRRKTHPCDLKFNSNKFNQILVGEGVLTSQFLSVSHSTRVNWPHACNTHHTCGHIHTLSRCLGVLAADKSVIRATKCEALESKMITFSGLSLW